MADRPRTAARFPASLMWAIMMGIGVSACSTVDDVRTVTDVEVTRALPGTERAPDTSTGSGTGTGTGDTSDPPLIDLGNVIVTAVDTIHGGPWMVQPFAVGDTGPTDLAKAISDDGASDAEKVLTDAGFIDGFQQLFTANTDDQLVVQLFRFETAGGASNYLQRWSGTLGSIGQPFEVINLPDAVAIGVEDATVQSAVVLLSYDVTFIAVQANVAAGVVSNQEIASIAADVARQQLAKLIVTTR